MFGDMCNVICLKLPNGSREFEHSETLLHCFYVWFSSVSPVPVGTSVTCFCVEECCADNILE